MSTRRKVLFAVLAAVVFLIVIGSVGGGDGPSTSDGFGARYACEQWVKQQLKAPSTADFVDGDIEVTGTAAWTITGSVDAQNSFGAQIRTPWSCTVEDLGDTYQGSATLLAS